MPNNLDINTFRNGDPISHAKTAAEWQKAGLDRKPAWCYYENDSNYGRVYGKLYNWYAVNDLWGLAPQVGSPSEVTVISLCLRPRRPSPHPQYSEGGRTTSMKLRLPTT